MSFIERVKALGKDASGNRFVIGDDGGVTLTLTGGNNFKQLHIGRLQEYPQRAGKLEDSYITYTKRESEKAIFKSNGKNGSWSLPWFILDLLPPTAEIFFITEKHMYFITAKKAKETGSFLWFKSTGFEKKFYIKLEDWSKTKDMTHVQQAIDFQEAREGKKEGIVYIPNKNNLTNYLKEAIKEGSTDLQKKSEMLNPEPDPPGFTIDINTWLNGIPVKKVFAFLESLDIDIKRADFRKETYDYAYAMDLLSGLCKTFRLSIAQGMYYLVDFVCINSGKAYKQDAKYINEE